MKKRLSKVLLLVLCLCLTLCVTVACVNNNGNGDGNITDGDTPDGEETPDDGKAPDNGEKPDYQMCTVKFDSNGGSAVADQTVKYCSKISNPEPPTKAGHTFEGWYCGDEEWSFIGYVVTEDMTLTAKWSINTCSVSISSATAYHTYEYQYGSRLSYLDIYISPPTGYYFVGLFKEDNTEWDMEHDIVEADIVLKAKYERIYYTVSFDTLGFGDIPSQTVEYGGTISVPRDPVGEEVFRYWSYNDEKWDFNRMVYSDITLVAVYSNYYYTEGPILRMATGYIRVDNGIFFAPETVDKYGVDGVITLADGKTYKTGDLKPTWVEVQNVLKVQFEDRYKGNLASTEFKYWQHQLDQVDMVSGTLLQIVEAGNEGKLVNMLDYLDIMPNFKKFLMDNPTVLLSIASIDSSGNIVGIYGAPYFDGMSDIERVPLMRVDWVEKLLNGEGEFTAEQYKELAAAVYTPYMPTSGKVEIDVVKADASGTEKIVKNYDKAGNIVANMNAAGTLNGVEAVNMLRKYIDEAYDGYYGTNRADLFIGQNAAWDADELVALLRCVVANPQTLNGTDNVEGLFSREDDNNQRRVDMFRFAGTLFGVRGLESRQDYLYVGTDGKLHDARQEADTYVALERMNAMVQEGLIASSFVNKEDTETRVMLENDLGFMHYDYNQFQTVYNETNLDEGEKYRAVLIPVARWYDGTDPNGVYMRFTESWRSVKTDCWAISAAGVAGDSNKLHAALALIDFAYSERGQILLSYGPDAFIKTNEDGSYVTFDFNGKQMPVIADATYEELWDKAGGNINNYARWFLGSCIGFVKNQAFEYQCTHVVGKEGMAIISNAIKYGLIKHPELAVTENPWYSIVPTTLPNTKAENDIIAGYTELSSNGKFSQSRGKTNLFCDIICSGYPGDEGINSSEELIYIVKNVWCDDEYLALKNKAFDRLVDYFNNNLK